MIFDVFQGVFGVIEKSKCARKAGVFVDTRRVTPTQPTKLVRVETWVEDLEPER